MNRIIGTQLRLLTWLDVERLLKQATHRWADLPENILAVDCFVSGMDIYHNAEELQVDQWLTKVFGHLYLPTAERHIKLKIGSTSYPINLIQDAGMHKITPPEYPLWKDVVYLPDFDQADDADDADEEQLHEPSPQPYQTVKTPVEFVGGPDLVSFHSFKGGVGRTSALMTYVTACFKESSDGPKKILVVDADLEAPGVTFWLRDVNRPDVSFVQLLEALHYPPTSTDDALEYFAAELKKTSYSVNGLERELFVLPAALDLSEIQDMPVTPEHLARNPANPWQLTDHLHALGKKLGVDAVFIDLRAGLSELAGPLLFDPRIDHFFVTTVAPQSVLGMAEVLRSLHAYNRRLPEDLRARAKPSVVLSLLTKELRESASYGDAIKRLEQAYPASEPLASQIEWLEASFNNSLMSIGDIDEALRSFSDALPLFNAAEAWAKALYAVQPELNIDDQKKSGRTENERKELAQNLYETCTKAAFAEGNNLGSLLAIEPLINMGKHFSKELPNALVIGAKGAGKTFTFRQIVQRQSWQKFRESVGFEQATTDAAIFPVLWSSNTPDSPDGEIKNAQRVCLKQVELADDRLLTLTEIFRQKDKALKESPEHWYDFWDKLIASQFGLSGTRLVDLNELMRSKGQRLVLVFDGLEDAFPDLEPEAARAALESLFRLPNRISELKEPHIGLLVFVRVDYVQSVIRQNVAQLLSRFEPFRLHWNTESFLRLAYMLSCQSGLYPNTKKAESMGMEELKRQLVDLWGTKLGSDKSKEALSARWVYTALCDLKGNIQARDLVRFLKFAAELEKERSGDKWSDRLLAPETMRKAIGFCSNEKVEEAKAEIQVLRKWIEDMERNNLHLIKIPFSAEQAGLDSRMLQSLKDLGVIYEDTDGKHGDERLYVPEIYRYGLGFETSAAGRPRTQALLKKNIGIIPL